MEPNRFLKKLNTQLINKVIKSCPIYW